MRIDGFANDADAAETYLNEIEVMRLHIVRAMDEAYHSYLPGVRAELERALAISEKRYRQRAAAEKVYLRELEGEQLILVPAD